MCSPKCSYQSALRFAAATSLSTIGRRAVSYACNAAGTSPPWSRSASASAIASSNARRVPDPIEKCAVRSASPMRTRLPTDQCSLRIFGKRRQIDLLATSGCPCKAPAKADSIAARVCASSIVSKPARCQVAASHSAMKVLIPGP